MNLPKANLFIVCIIASMIMTTFVCALYADSINDYQRALDLYANGKYLEAVSIFETVVASDSGYAIDAQFQIAACHREQGNIDDAINGFQKGLHMVKLPQDKVIMVELIKGLIQSYMDAGDWDNAMSLIPALDIYQGEWLQVEFYMRQGNFEKAASILTEIMKVSPDGLETKSIEPRKWMDWSSHTKDMDQYSAKMQSVAGTYPDTSLGKEAKMQIGLIKLWYNKKPAEARTYFIELLKNDSSMDKWALKHNIAYCSYVERNYSAAQALFQDIYANGTTEEYRSVALYMVGDCDFRMNNYAGAKSMFEKVISEFPSSAVASKASERSAQVQAKIKELSQNIAALPTVKEAQNASK